MIIYILFIIGFFLLIKGADLLIKGAITISTKYKIPQLITGIIILALGTSLPELIINIHASIINESNIVTGNIAGSNIANTMLILAVGAMMTTLIFTKKTFKTDINYALHAAYAVLALLLTQFFLYKELIITRLHGIILLLILAMYITTLFKRKKEITKTIKEEQQTTKKTKTKTAILQIIAGIIGLYLGGEWIVQGTITISQNLGLTTSFIGSSIIALGTSLPELTTTILSIIKKKNNLAIGNIIGSNILNILLVFAVSAMIAPITFTQVSIFNFLFVAFTMLLLMLSLIIQKIKYGEYALKKHHGIIFLIIYITYITISYIA